jgi:hypothetical protein
MKSFVIKRTDGLYLVSAKNGLEKWGDINEAHVYLYPAPDYLALKDGEEAIEMKFSPIKK